MLMQRWKLSANISVLHLGRVRWHTCSRRWWRLQWSRSHWHLEEVMGIVKWPRDLCAFRAELLLQTPHGMTVGAATQLVVPWWGSTSSSLHMLGSGFQQCWGQLVLPTLQNTGCPASWDALPVFVCDWSGHSWLQQGSVKNLRQEVNVQ